MSWIDLVILILISFLLGNLLMLSVWLQHEERKANRAKFDRIMKAGHR